jgi:hypothetical protein
MDTVGIPHERPPMRTPHSPSDAEQRSLSVAITTASAAIIAAKAVKDMVKPPPPPPPPPAAPEE